MPRKAELQKAEAQKQFNELLQDRNVSPELVLVAVMSGQTEIKVGSKAVKITDKMIEAAKTLLPHRLPRLNAIDADVRNVDMTHEEWLASLDDDEE